MFLTDKEEEISNEYLKNGYVIKPVDNIEALNEIKNEFITTISKIIGGKISLNPDDILNNTHNYVSPSELNPFRMKIIQSINSRKDFRELYFKTARSYLELLVGNELVMQNRINLSIQLPGDDSSLLTVHADTWTGDSPYEAVVWIPLVDCFKTKSMYILTPDKFKKIEQFFLKKENKSSSSLYQEIKKDVTWLDVKFGEVLIFNQSFPHGNIVNEEPDTRWTMNCRFKSIYTPYGDKKIGEFFEPITLRAASKAGMVSQSLKIK